MMSDIRIIGLGHKKRSGKDTVGNYLENMYGFIHLSFAESLKEACAAIFRLTPDQQYGDLKEIVDPRWNKSPRQILQMVGNVLRENIDSEVWIKSLLAKLNQYHLEMGYTRFVITDVRFPNEADAILNINSNCKVFKINRNVPLDENSNHLSETALDNYTRWSGTIDNNSSITDLYSKIREEILQETND